MLISRGRQQLISDHSNFRGSMVEESMLAKFMRWLLSSNDPSNLSIFIPIIAEWLARTGCINDAWVKPETYELFQAHGFHLVRNHYYGVLPDTRQLKESWWTSAPYAAAYDRVKKADLDSNLKKVLQWAKDLMALPREAEGGFFWNNWMYPPLDAIALYGLLREYQPRRLLEIGSGFSTEIALMAARHTRTAIECIEPYPTRQLLSRERELIALTRVNVQELPLDKFRRLEAGDFLFIDTTHTVKIGSDVNYLIFNVLPSVAPGVFIHFHDIFLPYEYPKRWYDETSIFWNEQYLLLAYLLDNSNVEVILPNYLLSIQHSEKLRVALQRFDIWDLTKNLGGASGASMWLKKL